MIYCLYFKDFFFVILFLVVGFENVGKFRCEFSVYEKIVYVLL